MKKNIDPRGIPVSKRELAAYLGVSATLLSMTDTGRHGNRHLGGKAAEKKAKLWLVHEQGQKSGKTGPSLQKLREANKAIAKTTMLTEAKYADSHATVLQNKLNEMLQKEQQDINWLKTMDKLLSLLPASEKSANDRIWIAYQQQRALERLEKNGFMAQVKLQIQIATAKAKAGVYKAASKKIIGK